MTVKSRGGVSAPNGIVTTLRELISALDRRMPQVDRPGEIRIARDAEILRRAAVEQIDILSRQDPDDKPYDQELVDAVMTDDGWPIAREGHKYSGIR